MLRCQEVAKEQERERVGEHGLLSRAAIDDAGETRSGQHANDRRQRDLASQTSQAPHRLALAQRIGRRQTQVGKAEESPPAGGRPESEAD